jgi:hypothetical protein
MGKSGGKALGALSGGLLGSNRRGVMASVTGGLTGTGPIEWVGRATGNRSLTNFANELENWRNFPKMKKDMKAALNRKPLDPTDDPSYKDAARRKAALQRTLLANRSMLRTSATGSDVLGVSR